MAANSDILCRCVIVSGVSTKQTKHFISNVVGKHLKQGQHIVNAECVDAEPEESAKWIVQLNTVEAAQKLCNEVVQEEINVEKDRRRTIKYERAQLHQVPENWKYTKQTTNWQETPVVTPTHGINVPHPQTTYTPYIQPHPAEAFQNLDQPMNPNTGIQAHPYGIPPTANIYPNQANQYPNTPLNPNMNTHGYMYPGLPPVSSPAFPANQYQPIVSSTSQAYPVNFEYPPAMQRDNTPATTAMSPSQTHSENQYAPTASGTNQGYHFRPTLSPGYQHRQTHEATNYMNLGSQFPQTSPAQRHANPEIQHSRAPPDPGNTRPGNQTQQTHITSSQPSHQYRQTSAVPSQNDPGHQYPQSHVTPSQPNTGNQQPQMHLAPSYENHGNLYPQNIPNPNNINQGNQYFNFPVRQPFPLQSQFSPQEVPFVPYPRMHQNIQRPPQVYGQGYNPYQYPHFGQMHQPRQPLPMNYPDQQPMFIHPERDYDREQSAIKGEHNRDNIHYSENSQRQVDLPDAKPSKVQKTPVLPDSEADKSEETQTQTSVKVTGISGISSKQTLELYFENKRRSGGGGVEEIRYDEEDEDIMYVQYTNASDAKEVVARKHKLNGCELLASPYVPPPYHDNRVLIDGLKTSTTRDCLFNFLEAKADCDPTDLCAHTENKSIVLVTVETSIDFEKLRQVCSRNKLEGKTLCVARVPVSNCILVTNLPPKVSDDMLVNYFENKRKSGGGPVEKVKPNEDRSACFIYFEDYRDVEGVITKSHKLNNVYLNVELYQPCLGHPQCFIKQKREMPTDFTLKEVDPHKLKFLKNSKAKLEVEAKLHDCHAAMKLLADEKDSVIFECTSTDSTISDNSTMENWEDVVTAAFNGFMEQIVISEAVVSQDDWQMVTEKLKTIHIENPEAVTVALNSNTKSLIVTGLKPVATQLFNKIETIIDEQKKATELKKQTTTEHVTTLNETECKMLNMTGFPRKINDTHTNLRVTINENNNEVIFEGISEDIKDAKLKMYETKNKFGLKKFDVTDNLSLQIYRSEQTRHYISDVFQSRQLQCLWEVTENTITVYSENEDIIGKCFKIVSRAVVVHKIDVNKESVAYLETTKCQQNVKEIQRRHEGKALIEVNGDDGSVIVCTLENLLEDIVCEVDEDISKNASLQTKVSCSRNEIVYIEKNLRAKLNDIAEQLQAYRVLITPKRTGFLIQGTEEGTRKAQKQIQVLLESLKQKNRTFDKPGFASFIKTRSGKDELHTIESDLSCLIVVKGENVDDSHGKISESAKSGQAMNVFATCRLQDDIDIQAALCDITKLTASVIVNNTDEKLSMSYGLGKIIAIKGGREVKESCCEYIGKHGKLRECDVFASPAGKLKANYILHVTVPNSQRGHSARDKLETAIANCLQKAVELKAQSIAIPAIGCGAAKFPVDTATDAIVTALESFFRKQPESTLTSVILCDMKYGVVEEFTRALVDSFGRKRVTVSMDRKKHNQDTSHRKQRGREDDGPYDRKRKHSVKTDKVTLGNITVSVLKGAVAKQKVDAIVNVVDKSLDLKRGTVSATLLELGGTELQQELNAKFPNGLEFGQIAVTSGQRLTCRFVIHCRLGPWKGSSVEAGVESLQTFMKICLNGAHQQNVGSIVFPAIGTGKLAYPKDAVAKELFASIASFSKDNQQTSLKEVRVVIYQEDYQTMKAFEEESCHWTTGKRVGLREMRMFHSDHEDDVDGKIYKIGRMKLTIRQGNILEEDTDCIVNSLPYSMDLRKGAVSRGIYKKCGDEITEELEKKKDWMKRFDLVTTAAPNLSCKCIIHVAVQESIDGWRKMVEKSLKRAEEKQICSIAFPALGTSYRNGPKEMADCIITAIVEFEKTNPQNVNDVRLVIFQSEMLQAFHSAASTVSSDILGNLYRGVRKEDPDKITFTIVAMENDIIDRAARKIEKCYEQKEFSDDLIKGFNRYYSKQLEEVERQEKVLVNVDKGKGRIQLCGLTENVRKASDRVHGIMREAVKFEKNKTSADLMSHMIQWFYTDTSGSTQKLVPYDKTINFKIENAYDAKDSSVTFRNFKKVQYKIDFSQMKEYPVDKPADLVTVVRKDMVKDGSGSPPATWTPMTSNLMVVPLATTDQEYSDTEKAFKTSFGTTINVVKIERVQNKALWQQYQAKKQQMEKQNPPNTKNESLLWHGSGDVGIENIKVHGFDRGYSNMGCSIGVGVYFSPLASVSRGYARADSAGIQKMFRCRVLTGEYCLGQRSLRVPPAKPGSGPHAKYDCVVNNMNTPIEFVIFNDTQAYPEYLIHFKP